MHSERETSILLDGHTEHRNLSCNTPTRTGLEFNMQSGLIKVHQLNCLVTGIKLLIIVQINFWAGKLNLVVVPGLTCYFGTRLNCQKMRIYVSE